MSRNPPIQGRDRPGRLFQQPVRPSLGLTHRVDIQRFGAKGDRPMVLYVGDDWAEDHHDVHLMDESGERLAARRLPEGVAGVTALHGLVAQHAAGPGDVVIGIETDRGPWVSALVAAGYRVYAINPRSASRYRDRHHVGGAKSDAGDARLLADLVRTDRHNHRAGRRRQRRSGRGAHPRPRPPAVDLGPRPPDQPAAQRAQGVLPGRTGGLPRPCPRRRGGRAVTPRAARARRRG